jgi:hypothetical protein
MVLTSSCLLLSYTYWIHERDIRCNNYPARDATGINGDLTGNMDTWSIWNRGVKTPVFGRFLVDFGLICASNRPELRKLIRRFFPGSLKQTTHFKD